MDDQHSTTFIVSPADEGSRLDRLCASQSQELSRNQVQLLNGRGGIQVDGRRRPDSFTVSAGETIEMHPHLLEPPGLDDHGSPEPQDIPVRVVFEDDSVVVVNKKAGMVVHPAHGNWGGTLVNALFGRGTTLASLGSPERPGIVHRLDKDTTGLIVVARTDNAYRELSEQIKQQRFGKVYHAIALGNVGSSRMSVEAPIGRHPVKRQQMAVVEGTGKPARTDLFVVDSYSHFDYIRLTTYTGRTHQIRVHLSHIGHPLLGDPVYGGRRQRGTASHTKSRVAFERLLKIVNRHALHATELSFVHPDTGARMRFRTALPDDMRQALEMISREDRIKEV